MALLLLDRSAFKRASPKHSLIIFHAVLIRRSRLLSTLLSDLVLLGSACWPYKMHARHPQATSRRNSLACWGVCWHRCATACLPATPSCSFRAYPHWYRPRAANWVLHCFWHPSRCGCGQTTPCNGAPLAHCWSSVWCAQAWLIYCFFALLSWLAPARHSQ